ncbi:MAG: CHAT domain-containing protein [Desulfobulbus sp.]|nr:CHAT domain-containing protein [Desulfobulbus sp.]
MEDFQLLDALERVNCEEEGRELLLEHAPELNDEIGEALQEKANELRQGHDPDGAAEFESWAAYARSLVTRHLLLSIDTKDAHQTMAQLQARRDRFDLAFGELCIEKVCAPFGVLQIRLAARDLAGAEELADSVRHHVEFELQFTRAIANIGKNPEIQGQVDFCEGSWRQLLWGIEALHAALSDANEPVTVASADTQYDWLTLPSATPEAQKLHQQARDRYLACAANERTPARLRAQSECNLAALAYPDLPKVKAHQSAALALADKTGEHRLARVMRRRLAYWASKEGDWQQVYHLLDENLKSAEKATLSEYSPQLVSHIVQEARVDVSQMLDACLELGKRDPVYWQRALEVVEWGKSRAHLRAAQLMATSYGEIPRRLQQRRERLQALTRDLENKLGLLPEEIVKRHKDKMARLLTLTAQVETQMAKFSRLRAYDLRCFPLKYAEMVKAVPVDATVLCFFQQSDRVVIFVLGSEGLCGQPVEVPLESKRLAQILVQLEFATGIRADFADWNRIQIDLDTQIEAIYPFGALKMLYQALITPVHDRIMGNKMVYISADGTLLRIPLHASLKDDTTALIDEIPVAYSPGIAVLHRALVSGRRSATPSVFAAGVMKEKGGPACSLEEAKTVARLFGVQVAPATYEALIQQGMKSDILHLSCHSNTTSRLTSGQGLQLEDRLLTPTEIGQAGCQAGLVFQSACETSRSDMLEDGMELIGLVGSFMRCGVPSIVATLWKMPDSVSIPLAEAYYTELGKNGTNRAVALQKAVQAIKRQQRFSHPYFWASICLYGAA